MEIDKGEEEVESQNIDSQEHKLEGDQTQIHIERVNSTNNTL